MRIIIRAEDLYFADNRLILGGRIIQPDAIVFTHIEKRVSAELLGGTLAGVGQVLQPKGARVGLSDPDAPVCSSFTRIKNLLRALSEETGLRRAGRFRSLAG